MVCTLGTGLTRRGYTPFLVLLTDGRGNIALDGSTNRAAATEDALKAGRAIAAAGLAGVVIDISPAPAPKRRPSPRPCRRATCPCRRPMPPRSARSSGR
jgi:magnesium chelatase subunit D